MRALTRSTLLVALLLAAACGDGRLKNLAVGIDRDSVAVVMETAAPYRSESYLVGGKFWEVMLYTRPGAESSTDSIPARELSPVVLADGAVAGWGWDYWEKQATEMNIPVPAKD
ncbi:MAG: hypothetical protein AB7N73_07955 [Gemmatimonadales bacterium]